MRRKFSLLILCICLLPVFLSGCFGMGASVGSNDIGSEIAFLEMDTSGGAGCAVILTIPRSTLNTAEDKDGVAVAFATQMREEMMGLDAAGAAAVTFNSSGQYSLTGEGYTFYAASQLDSYGNIGMSAQVTMDTKEQYLDYMSRRESILGVTSVLSDFQSEYYYKQNQGIYVQSGYRGIPLPIAAWYTDFELASFDQGVFAELLGSKGMGAFMKTTALQSIAQKLNVTYALITSEFNTCSGDMQKTQNGSRLLSFSATLDSDGAPYVTDGIAIFRKTQLLWAWVLIGIGIVALAGGAIFAGVYFTRKNMPIQNQEPIVVLPRAPVDPFSEVNASGSGGEESSERSEPKDENPFGNDYK